jgi:putative transposase
VTGRRSSSRSRINGGASAVATSLCSVTGRLRPQRRRQAYAPLTPREGAGRPRGSRTSTRIPHTKRPSVSRHKPHHVTVRVTRGTWNLRSQRCFRPVAAALKAVVQRGIRVVHFSVQHNHIHLIVEADNRPSMSRGMRFLLSRIARGLNDVMKATGARFDDRYHEHILRTPTEALNALRYVIGNRAVHLARWGKTIRTVDDEFCSLSRPTLTAPASAWLLTEGWTRAGP